MLLTETNNDAGLAGYPSGRFAWVMLFSREPQCERKSGTLSSSGALNLNLTHMKFGETSHNRKSET